MAWDSKMVKFARLAIINIYKIAVNTIFAQGFY